MDDEYDEEGGNAVEIDEKDYNHDDEEGMEESLRAAADDDDMGESHNNTINTTDELEDDSGERAEGEEERDSEDHGEDTLIEQKDDVQLYLAITKMVNAVLRPARRSWLCSADSPFHQPQSVEIESTSVSVTNENYRAVAPSLRASLQQLKTLIETQEKAFQLLPAWLLKRSLRGKEIRFTDDNNLHWVIQVHEVGNMPTGSRVHQILSRRVARLAVTLDTTQVVKVLLARRHRPTAEPPASLHAPVSISRVLSSEGASTSPLLPPSPITEPSIVEGSPNPVHHRGGALRKLGNAELSSAAVHAGARAITAVSVSTAVRSVINNSHYNARVGDTEVKTDGVPALMAGAAAATRQLAGPSSTSSQPEDRAAPLPAAPASSLTPPLPAPPRFRHPTAQPADKRVKDE